MHLLFLVTGWIFVDHFIVFYRTVEKHTQICLFDFASGFFGFLLVLGGFNHVFSVADK